jgi:prepilin-type N-terminal cleavage/methylation domain-containing protein
MDKILNNQKVGSSEQRRLRPARTAQGFRKEISLSAGFSLIELMVVIAIMGTLSATAMPAYQSYISAAEIAKVDSAYSNAVTIVRQEYSKDITMVSLGLVSTLPLDNAAWIKVFSGTTKSSAPDGGPAYRPGHQPNNESLPTGAVYVNVHSAYLCITRSQFHELIALKTRVWPDATTVEEL